MQALVLARRFAAAAERLDSIPLGADRVYLHAEVAWRQGDLAAAIALLQNAVPHHGSSPGSNCSREGSCCGGCSSACGIGAGQDSKHDSRGGSAGRSTICGAGGADAGKAKLVQLLARLQPLAVELRSAEDALEDGEHPCSCPTATAYDT